MIDHSQCWFSLITYLGFQYIKYTCVLADLIFGQRNVLPLVSFLLAENVFELFLHTVAIANILFLVFPYKTDFDLYNDLLTGQITIFSEQTLVTSIRVNIVLVSCFFFYLNKINLLHCLLFWITCFLREGEEERFCSIHM